MVRPWLRSVWRAIRWCCVLVFLLTLAVAVRGLFSTGGDSFHFGDGDHWYGYSIIAFSHGNLGIETSLPAHARFPGRGWFFEHHAGPSAYAWGPDPDVSYHSGIRWRFFETGRDELAGVTIRRYYWFTLGPLPAILLPASACVLASWWWSGHRSRQRRRAQRQGLCPNCRYDLRAHRPGDKCPECGTTIAMSATRQSK